MALLRCHRPPGLASLAVVLCGCSVAAAQTAADVDAVGASGGDVAVLAMLFDRFGPWAVVGWGVWRGMRTLDRLADTADRGVSIEVRHTIEGGELTVTPADEGG